MLVEREWTFDDPATSRYTLLLDRNGQWYKIEYLINEERTVLPETVRQYIETLQWAEDRTGGS